MPARYALYFSPEDTSSLGLYGKTILGRTARSQRTDDASSSFNDQARWHSLTRKPAHYGFHATLKAPFELMAGSQLTELTSLCRQLATRLEPIELAGLAPGKISNFAALSLRWQPDTLTALARDCVEALEPVRAPISEQDIQRRLHQPLSDRQLLQLKRYGYPYIFDDFQFHMTLSDQLSASDADYLLWLEQEYTQLVTSVPVLDRIALYTQSDRKSAFVMLEAYCLS